MNCEKFFLSLLLTVSSLPASSLLFASFLEKSKAVVVAVPVTDLVAQPLAQVYPSKSLEQAYQELPYSPNKGENSCVRVHQCLFNEIGILSDSADGELLVEFPHFFCKNPKTGEKSSKFWVLAKNVVLLSKIKEATGSFLGIPEPITEENGVRSNAVVTLLLPWTDEETGVSYSAGTRFLRVNQDDQRGLFVLITNFTALKTKVAYIKNEYLCDPVAQDRLKLFTSILKKWAAFGPSIPYVWGGCSILDRAVPEYTLVSQGDPEVLAWERPGSAGPHAGLDCSGLILRAAQIAGFHYFYENTTTLGLMLSDVPDSVQEGDLILFPGHVMVFVGDDGLVDAAGYSNGYGCVRCVNISQAFLGLTTYEDLFEELKSKHLLKFILKPEGQVKEYPSFRILRMPHE